MSYLIVHFLGGMTMFDILEKFAIFISFFIIEIPEYFKKKNKKSNKK